MTDPDIEVVKGPDFEQTGTWHVSVDGRLVGMVDRVPGPGRSVRYQPYNASRARLGDRPCRTRRDAVIAVLMSHRIRTIKGPWRCRVTEETKAPAPAHRQWCDGGDHLAIGECYHPFPPVPATGGGTSRICPIGGATYPVVNVSLGVWLAQDGGNGQTYVTVQISSVDEDSEAELTLAQAAQLADTLDAALNRVRGDGDGSAS